MRHRLLALTMIAGIALDLSGVLDRSEIASQEPGPAAEAGMECHPPSAGVAHHLPRLGEGRREDGNGDLDPLGEHGGRQAEATQAVI